MALLNLSKNLQAIVDDNDFDFLNQHKWSASLCGVKYYAVRSNTDSGKRKTEYLHRYLLGITDKNVCIDHINLNTLDNRRENLRVCSKTQNNRNIKKRTGISKYKGIVFVKDCHKKWEARITVNKKIKLLGRYETEIEAAEVYNKAAVEYYGEFANLNIIDYTE